MKLPIVMYGHPLLRKKSQNISLIDEEILRLIRDMKETMLHAKGIGLAAPQVGKSVALLLTNIPQNEDELDEDSLLESGSAIRVFINPKIISYDEENWVHDEGCLSIPRVYVPVPRPVSVVIEAQDETGNHFQERLSGWPARVFCHENDHLNGVLHIDRTTAREKQRIEPTLKRIKEQFKKHNEQF